MTGRRPGPRGADWEPLARQLRELAEGHEDEIRAFVKAANPAFDDQMRAAVADAERKEAGAVAFMRKQAGPRFGHVRSSQAPEQLMDRLYGLYIRIVTELTTGDREACPHIRPDAPVPFIALVFGDRADCWPCTRRRGPVRPVLTATEEHTCDLCGTYRPQQTMHQITPRFGPATIIAGACDDCMAPLAKVASR